MLIDRKEGDSKQVINADPNPMQHWEFLSVVLKIKVAYLRRFRMVDLSQQDIYLIMTITSIILLSYKCYHFFSYTE